MKTRKLIVLCMMVIVLGITTYIVYNYTKDKEEKKEDTNIYTLPEKVDVEINSNEIAIASMYYSYMLGMDAGTEYTVLIYEHKNGNYKYIINTSEIYEWGASDPKEYSRGIIKTKEDLNKINNYFMNLEYDGISITNSEYRHMKGKVNFSELERGLFK